MHDNKGLMNYYRKPSPDPVFKTLVDQYKYDTRVKCPECGAYYLPAIVITDGNPQNECQFLCRTQTIVSIEEFYSSKFEKKVLTANKKNKMILDENSYGIRVDIKMNELKTKPALITNFLQYSPAYQMLNFINDESYEKADCLYDMKYSLETKKILSVNHS
jgi:hypothetical protein